MSVLFFGLTQEVINFFFPSFLDTINEIPFSHSILNRFWSTRSQMIDIASYYEEKFMIFYENSEISSKKEF